MLNKIQTIINHCNCKNIKVTQLREQILNILTESNKPCSAYHVLDELKKIRANAEPMTVYRVLDFLVSNNIVHKLEAKKKYALCCHPNAESCQIFICKNCNKKYEFHDSEISMRLKKITEELNLELCGNNIEVYGYCKKCK